MTDVNREIARLTAALSLKPGDTVYVVSHRPERSLSVKLLDLLAGGAVDLAGEYAGGAFRYLVATDRAGEIYRIDRDEPVKICEIPQWSADRKDSFRRATVDGICYKSIRKVSVN